MFNSFYLPKNIYTNITQLAKENHTTISNQLVICLKYAQEHQPLPRQFQNAYTEEQLPYIETVHFIDKGTSDIFKEYLRNQNPSLTPIQIVNLLNYGQFYQRLEERKELIQNAKSTN